ncbi:MAG: DUF503 domain-containing protein [Planctomycetota bacterium]|jgi:uncharacterized protein YlxP (DUF503 family)
MLHIGVLQFHLAIPYSASLKDKRSVVKSLKDRLKRHYNVSIAEIDDLDIWNIATLGAVMAGSDVAYINSAMDKLIDTLEELREATLEDHQLEIISPPS